LREILVTILRDYHFRRNVVIAANIWGKLKTITQMVGIIAFLGFFAWQGNHPNTLVLFVFRLYFWLVAVITLLSGLNYFLIKHNNNLTESV
jgi:CDP-diacylglycerol--glycerol-3-phosphate 3-phosphatidyltransferase